MIRKTWNFLGDLRLTFWLLMAAIVMFLTGTFYTNNNFAFFNKMNEMRIQDWMVSYMPDNIGITWWLPLLLLVMALIGINTFICSWNRISALIPLYGQMTFRNFFHAISPSLIHVFFLTVMLGHLITFTTGSWERAPIQEGTALKINGSEFTVLSVKNEFFPDSSKLAGRVSQTRVLMKSREFGTVELSYLNRVQFMGYDLHLDMQKMRKKDILKEEKNVMLVPEDQENCNRAAVYNLKNTSRQRKHYLLAVSDPGLPVIVTGFSILLALMLWYFIEAFRKKGGASA